MYLIIVSGFWLGASAWSEVTPIIEQAGHSVNALTLPGLRAVEENRSSIGLRHHVNAVVEAIDAAGPGSEIVLVGHNGGGAIAYAAVDERPTAVARVIYIDSAPLADGENINPYFDVVDDGIPLPPWSDLPENDLVDLTDGLRQKFRALAVPQPARVANEPQRLADPRRFDVPATVICCGSPSSVWRAALDADEAWVAELAAVTSREFVDLPTGNWPQFTRPRELGEAIVATLGR